MDTSRRRFFLWPCLGTLHFGWYFCWNRVNLLKRVGYVKVVRIFEDISKKCWLYFVLISGLNYYSSLYNQFWPQICCMLVGGKITNSHHAYNWNLISSFKFHSWKSSFFRFTGYWCYSEQFYLNLVLPTCQTQSRLLWTVKCSIHLFIVLAGETTCKTIYFWKHWIAKLSFVNTSDRWYWQFHRSLN